MTIGTEKDRAAFVQFSNNSRTEFNLTAYSRKQDLQEAILYRYCIDFHVRFPPRWKRYHRGGNLYTSVETFTPRWKPLHWRVRSNDYRSALRVEWSGHSTPTLNGLTSRECQ